MQYSPNSLGHFINHLSQDYAKRNAFTYYFKYRTRCYTYREITDWARKVSVYFHEMGIQKGDRVIIFAPNCPEWAAVLLCAGLTGIVLVPIDFNATWDLVEKICHHTNPKLILTDKENIPSSMQTPHGNIDRLFFIVKDLDVTRFEERDTYICDDDIFEIVYTSGTTSDPKGVVIRQKNIVANLHALRLGFRCNPSWKFLSMLPLSHMLEQTAGLFAPLRFGCEVVYTKHKNFSAISGIIRSHKITTIVAVPTILTLFKTKIEDGVTQKGKLEKLKSLLLFLHKTPFPLRRTLAWPIRKHVGIKLDSFICGGAALSRSVEDFWEDLGIRILQGYGLTEAAPIATFNSYDVRIKGSVGKCLKGQAVKISENGEILIAGENVFSGYYKRSDLDSEYFENGWYKTGDLGYYDDKHNLFITGRKKNMIVGADGLNVFPEDIESVINEKKDIQECVVFADEEDGGTHIVAAVITEDLSIDMDQLKREINSNLQAHQCIHTMIKWPDTTFPKTPTLKIKRNDVIKRYKVFRTDNAVSHVGKGITVLDKITTTIANQIKVPAHTIGPETHLANDLGFDSLKCIELLVALETVFKKEINGEAFNNKAKVKDIVKCVEESSQTNNEQTSTARLKNPVTQGVRRILFPIMQLVLFRSIFGISVKKSGYHVSRNDTPVIFIANHQSHLDTPSILFSLPASTRFKTTVAAADDFFFKQNTFFLGIMAFMLNLFPFYRKNNFKANFDTIGALLDRNNSVLIYPEGTRSRDGTMASFKKGIGVIVREMDVPVIPIKIEHSFDLLPYNKKVPKRGTINVHFGDKMIFKEETAEEITGILEKAVKEINSSIIRKEKQA